MRRNLIFVFTLTAGFLFLSGQSMAQQSDPEALELLQKISDKYSAYQSMSMDFKLIIKDLENDTEEEKTGELFIKGMKFRLSLDEQIIVSNNETIWTYLKDVNELQINDYETDDEFLTPSQLFSVAESDYYAILGEHFVENDKKIQVVVLTPRDKEVSYYKLKLYINISDFSLQKGVVMDKSGIHFTYMLNNFKANPGLTDANFNFDASAHEGIEVIDLRE